MRFLILIAAPILLLGCPKIENPLAVHIPPPAVERMTDGELVLWEEYYAALEQKDLTKVNEMLRVPEGSVGVQVAEFTRRDAGFHVRVEITNTSSQAIMIPELTVAYGDGILLLSGNVTSPRYVDLVAPGDTVALAAAVASAPPVPSESAEVVFNTTQITRWDENRMTVTSGPVASVPMMPEGGE